MGGEKTPHPYIKLFQRKKSAPNWKQVQGWLTTSVVNFVTTLREKKTRKTFQKVKLCQCLALFDSCHRGLVSGHTDTGSENAWVCECVTFLCYFLFRNSCQKTAGTMENMFTFHHTLPIDDDVCECKRVCLRGWDLFVFPQV